MSAFLGPIHFWLYNKIEVEENILNEIIEFANTKDKAVLNFKNESEDLYGKAKFGKLEDLIDQGNIHGWLQSCITSVDTRLAYIITKVIDNNILSFTELESIFYKSGEKYSALVSEEVKTPQDVFNNIYNYLLAGMPCDRVNEVVKNEVDEIVWETTFDVHKKYWDEVNSDVNIYHKLEKLWIKSFVENVNNEFEYNRDDFINTIKRR